jgi:signal transduction histidine kinase
MPIRTYIQFFGSSSPDDLCWREDGTSFPIEYESAPLTDDGRVVGLVVTLRDISQREAAEALKDELISIASHELRTPLTSIRSSLGLLISGRIGRLPQKGQRMLEIAVRNTDRLIRLINDILDLERVDSGEIRMASVVCDTTDLMTQAADGVRALADQAGVELRVVPTNARLRADPDRLIQVMTNLLANAIKFSLPGGGKVWIDAEHSAGELVFRVHDEGRGIPPDKLEIIFERFAQVEDSDAREKGGSGLGLAISRSIVKQHGGQIWAESTTGAGTTLFVALPYEETEVPHLLPARPDQCGETDAAA